MTDPMRERAERACLCVDFNDGPSDPDDVIPAIAAELTAVRREALEEVKDIAICAEMWRDSIEGGEFWSYSEELRELLAAVDKYRALAAQEPSHE